MAWNKPSEEAKPNAKAKSWRARPLLRGVIAGAVVVAGALAAWLLLAPSTTRTQASDADEPKLIKGVKPAVTPPRQPPVDERPSGKAHLAETNLPAAYLNAKGLDPNLFPYDDGRKVISTRTNSWDQIIDICIMPSGRSRKVVRDAKPPVFEHATDQLIAMALAGSNDEETIPLPISEGMEPEFLESLKTPIVIRDDDSEPVRRSKERVIEARQIINEELRKGRSFKSILDEHVAQRKGNAEMRATAMQTVSELRESGDASTVNEYVKKVNELFRQKGIGEISGQGGRRHAE